MLSSAHMYPPRPIYLILLGLLFLASCQTSTVIVTNVPGREANEIVVLLQSYGIEAQKQEVTATTTAAATTTEQMWDITVPASQITKSLAILNRAGLPRVKGTTLLQLFGSQGLVPSDLQDKIRYQEGLSEQLANTIRKMDGVIDASVQITFPQDEEQKQPLTASVYVKHRGIMDNPNSLMVNKIKRLISSAIPGLTVDNVSVVSDKALFADITFPSTSKDLQEKNYVSIWGVIVAKESLTLFRIIFYLFIIFLFLFACALGWMTWKFYPLLRKKGFKWLINPQPYEEISKEQASEEMEEGGTEK